MNNTGLPNRSHLRNWLLIGTVAWLGISQLGAQGFGPRPGEGRLTPEEVIERMISRMDDRLDLTDEQEAEVREILKESQEKRALYLDAARDAESEGEAREQIKKAHDVGKEANKEIAELLDRKQRKEFKEMQKRMEQLRGRIGNRGAFPSKGNAGGPPPEDAGEY
ncbi:MAG: hypothetical protein Q7P63_13455 [Verrucomicrobiota bacterium JB022]|nr:hypothetical protein [Verrucomicrobiota bacterium JB022]